MSLAGAGESQIGCVPALQSECGVGLPSDGWPPKCCFVGGIQLNYFVHKTGADCNP